ncbi:uncharacterized protein BDZ83DRAFT_1120 [Colletotrichum acutatum]|uniref:Uncharacterized protein n=1 Tax=Glomerella acutata TaxID=27357 RepID=A0AAD8XQP9_GLOAC|nr:uncharacterized protein BDZ83DRAFT_1120 [Colletotrichum acutatum]KAK1731701.1 hypothetical protein BDZ83DRAFT_1120 [Colletotrichum acutatum]
MTALSALHSASRRDGKAERWLQGKTGSTLFSAKHRYVRKRGVGGWRGHPPKHTMENAHEGRGTGGGGLKSSRTSVSLMGCTHDALGHRCAREFHGGDQRMSAGVCSVRVSVVELLRPTLTTSLVPAEKTTFSCLRLPVSSSCSLASRWPCRCSFVSVFLFNHSGNLLSLCYILGFLWFLHTLPSLPSAVPHIPKAKHRGRLLLSKIFPDHGVDLGPRSRGVILFSFFWGGGGGTLGHLVHCMSR